MTNKQPLVSLFKRQNDRLVFETLQRTDADWIVIHNVVLEKDGVYLLSGNEYVIAHFDYGIVILDILPTLRTADEATKILLEKISHAAPSYSSPIQVWGVEHNNIENLSDYLNDITRQVAPELTANDKTWAEIVRKSLQGDLLGQPATTEDTYLLGDANFAQTRKTKPNTLIAPAVLAGAVSLIMLLLAAQYFSGHLSLHDSSKIGLASAALEIMLAPYSEPMFEPVSVDQVARPDTDVAFQVAAPVNVPSISLPTSVLPPSAPILPPSPPAPKLQEADPLVGQGHNDRGRLPRYSSANPNPAPRPNVTRCQAIIMRAQLGALQTSDLQFLRRGC
jgi:hypothetical protein